jgi:hypothetical protein
MHAAGSAGMKGLIGLGSLTRSLNFKFSTVTNVPVVVYILISVFTCSMGIYLLLLLVECRVKHSWL